MFAHHIHPLEFACGSGWRYGDHHSSCHNCTQCHPWLQPVPALTQAEGLETAAISLLPVWWMRVDIVSVLSQSSISAFWTDPKRIQTPHSIFWDFWAHKTFTTWIHWSGGRLTGQALIEQSVFVNNHLLCYWPTIHNSLLKICPKFQVLSSHFF